MKSTCDTAAGASIGQPLASFTSRVCTMRSMILRALEGSTHLCRAALLTLAASFVLPGASVLAEGDPAKGLEKAYTCLGCHGIKHYVNTYPTYHVPRIAGQHQEYLIAALQAYRGKTRSHPTMQANAGLLSDQDIEDIAAWFSAQGAK